MMISILSIQAALGLFFIGLGVNCTRNAATPPARATFTFATDWFKLGFGLLLFLTAFLHVALMH